MICHLENRSVLTGPPSSLILPPLHCNLFFTSYTHQQCPASTTSSSSSPSPSTIIYTTKFRRILALKFELCVQSENKSLEQKYQINLHFCYQKLFRSTKTLNDLFTRTRAKLGQSSQSANFLLLPWQKRFWNRWKYMKEKLNDLWQRGNWSSKFFWFFCLFKWFFNNQISIYKIFLHAQGKPVHITIPIHDSNPNQILSDRQCLSPLWRKSWNKKEPPDLSKVGKLA